METKETPFSWRLVQSMPENTEICGITRSVAPSGMSRTMSFVAPYANKETGAPEIMNLTHSIAEILGYKVILVNGFNAIRVHGCGMDMVFKVIYDLGAVMFKDGYYFRTRAL